MYNLHVIITIHLATQNIYKLQNTKHNYGQKYHALTQCHIDNQHTPPVTY